jgi:hypothetical protein
MLPTMVKVSGERTVQGMRPIAALSAVTISVLSVVLSGPVAGAVASTAPPVIPTGATSLTWSYPLPVTSKVVMGRMTITNQKSISRVRALINGLPSAASYGTKICTTDVIVNSPSILFSYPKQRHLTVRVGFQLGSCPTALISINGNGRTMPRGTSSLPARYNAIVHIISPRGQPLA